jgi:hypothetical protein
MRKGRTFCNGTRKSIVPPEDGIISSDRNVVIWPEKVEIMETLSHDYEFSYKLQPAQNSERHIYISGPYLYLFGGFMV